MSFQFSMVPLSSVNGTPADHDRSFANYQPGIWRDLFLNHGDISKIVDTSNKQHFEELKEKVRSMLTNTSYKPSQKLRLIDAVQRLGVGYHFSGEIEYELQKISHDCKDHENDLYIVALAFRLLRQHRISASCDVFEKFKDSEGKFKTSLTSDVSGMLSLYEAAHLGIRGEDVLDEALDFTTTNLQSALNHASPHLAEEIKHALNRPIRKCLPRLDARHYITTYSRDESHDKTLLQFAKLDFTILQGLHQKELHDIADQWWNKLDVATKLPYARDRIVEGYFWTMGIYFEPQYPLGRKIITKVIATLSFLDDTYDNYGTYEELELLTEAIQRWDIKTSDVLPECMKMVYSIIINLYNEIEEDLSKEGMSYAINYAKDAMKKLVRFYLAEIKWRDEGYIPTMEEYMRVSLVSSCYPMLILSSFLGMGAIATKEAFEWASSYPKIFNAASIIARLMDDIVSHQFEQKRVHVASAVECYMKEHSVTYEEVVKTFRKQIADAWKDINEEWLKITAVPMPLLERVLNFSRAMDVIYKDDDGYTNSHVLKDCVASLLKDPVLA